MSFKLCLFYYKIQIGINSHAQSVLQPQKKKTAYELKVETRTLRAYRNNFKYIVKYTCTIL